MSGVESVTGLMPTLKPPVNQSANEKERYCNTALIHKKKNLPEER